MTFINSERFYLFVNDSAKTNIYQLSSYDKIDRYTYKVKISAELYLSDKEYYPIDENEEWTVSAKDLCFNEAGLLRRLFNENIN